MSHLRFKVLPLVGAFLACGIAAQAALIFDGQTVELRVLFPDTSTTVLGPVTPVVGAGVEWAPGGGPFTYDVSDTQILITFVVNFPGGTGAAAFNGWQLFDINGTIPTFLSATLNGASTSSITPGAITFDANNIFVNATNLASVTAGQTILVDVTAVPEPGSLALIAVGLGSVWFQRRRSRRMSQIAR